MALQTYRVQHFYDAHGIIWYEGDEVALTDEEAAHAERDSPGVLSEPLRAADADLDELALTEPPPIQNRIVKRSSSRSTAKSAAKAKPLSAAAAAKAARQPGPPRGQFAGAADRVGGPADQGAMTAADLVSASAAAPAAEPDESPPAKEPKKD